MDGIIYACDPCDIRRRKKKMQAKWVDGHFYDAVYYYKNAGKHKPSIIYIYILDGETAVCIIDNIRGKEEYLDKVGNYTH